MKTLELWYSYCTSVYLRKWILQSQQQSLERSGLLLGHASTNPFSVKRIDGFMLKFTQSRDFSDSVVQCMIIFYRGGQQTDLLRQLPIQ